jgi:GNAT superfamily N-acetyltransferase
MSLEVVFRGRTAQDEPLIFQSWMDSLYESGEWKLRTDPRNGAVRGVPRVVFSELYKPVVLDLMRRAQFVIATFPEAKDTDVIVGWLALEEPETLHYVYVKPKFRRMGVAASLLDGLDVREMVYTHQPNGWWDEGAKAYTSWLLPEAWRYEPVRRFKEAS